jgi:hypothetical protein
LAQDVTHNLVYMRRLQHARVDERVKTFDYELRAAEAESASVYGARQERGNEGLPVHSAY